MNYIYTLAVVRTLSAVCTKEIRLKAKITVVQDELDSGTTKFRTNKFTNLFVCNKKTRKII